MGFAAGSQAETGLKKLVRKTAASPTSKASMVGPRARHLIQHTSPERKHARSVLVCLIRQRAVLYQLNNARCTS